MCVYMSGHNCAPERGENMLIKMFVIVFNSLLLLRLSVRLLRLLPSFGIYINARVSIIRTTPKV